MGLRRSSSEALAPRGSSTDVNKEFGEDGQVLIVMGHLVVDARKRDAYVVASAAAVRLARSAPGCLDFAVSADPVDPRRVNVAERWVSREALAAFRSSPSEEGATEVDFSVVDAFHIDEFDVPT